MTTARQRLGEPRLRRYPWIIAMQAAAVLMTSSACMSRLMTAHQVRLMERAQTALHQEPDYDLAAQAAAAMLKTLEGLWYEDRDNRRVLMLLAEGYCHYGLAFVEDDIDSAEVARSFSRLSYHQARATRMFIRCTNYGLALLGAAWREKLYTTHAEIAPLIAGAGTSQRDALMWTAIGLASTIHHNRDNIELAYHLPAARAMLERVVELDDISDNPDLYRRAMAHVALGTLHTAMPASTGGLPKIGEAHFRRALELTGDALLLASVLYASRYAVLTHNRALYRTLLLQVLQAAPGSWPERRLLNEIAHRRARRYLAHEAHYF